jgi:chromosome segregation ATPase
MVSEREKAARFANEEAARSFESVESERAVVEQRKQELAAAEMACQERDQELERECELLNRKIIEYNRRAKDLNRRNEDLKQRKKDFKALRGNGSEEKSRPAMTEIDVLQPHIAEQEGVDSPASWIE